MTDNQELIPGDNNLVQPPNRRGRPRNLDILQQLAHDILYEPDDLSTDQFARSRLEALLREWFTSGEFRKQKAVLGYAVGKPKRATSSKPDNKRIIVEWDK